MQCMSILLLTLIKRRSNMADNIYMYTILTCASYVFILLTCDLQQNSSPFRRTNHRLFHIFTFPPSFDRQPNFSKVSCIKVYTSQYGKKKSFQRTVMSHLRIFFPSILQVHISQHLTRASDGCSLSAYLFVTVCSVAEQFLLWL